jgi:hypothetical protein
MSAALREIIDIDTRIKPEMNSWTSPPDGFELLIQTGTPDYSLLIDDEDHRLLIQ